MSARGLERFGVAEHGVRWALSTAPGDMNVAFEPLPEAKGPDDWALRFGKDGARVLANSATGAIAAALELGGQAFLPVTSGRQTGMSAPPKDITRRLKFRTRIYKHESSFSVGPRTIVGYPDETWENLCREIARRQFNGLVFYPPSYHPFEHLLDYREFPYAVKTSGEERRRNREALNGRLRVAHQYGLTTLMQHYVGHFTKELAEHLGIRETPSGRLSAVDHPEVSRYCGWCYREICRQVPELDGLYFNFESAPDACEHVLTLAIPEFAKLAKKPTCVFRLWNNTDIEGVRSMVRAVHGYGGRAILSHKVADTSDTYHYPVADSRVLEWKKAIPEAEFQFCLGPCHNCGTNLCEQLWGDYDHVQALVGDVFKKGTDSIAFHSVRELLAEDVGGGVWPEDERTMSRWNILHLESVVDFVNGRVTRRGERARRLAARIAGPEQAGKAALDLIESTSRIIITVYEQFYHSAAWEGFLNPGRYSHIQDTFYFYPSNGINNTRKLNIWTAPLGEWCWITKTIPVKVTPDDEFEYIIDTIDPARRKKARRHPKLMADLLGKCVARSQAALAKLRALGLGAEAGRLEKFVRANALVGDYTRAEILAAIQLYSLYFAKTRPAMLKALRKGLALLEPLPAMLERDEFAKKSMKRALFWDWFGVQSEIDRVKELLATMEAADFPMAPFRRYVQSHVQYNNVRRICRAYHQQNAATLKYAAGRIRIAQRHAKAALAGLKGSAFRTNVETWLDYLKLELAHMTPPKAACPRGPSGEFHPLFHDDCFRMGEHFTEDFVSFFRPVDYERRSGISFATWNAGDALAISWREQGIDIEQRKAQWEKYRGSGSDVFVTRALIDAGDGLKKIIVWPMGQKVALGIRFVDVRTEFVCDATSWQTTAYLPFALLGRAPKPGETWRMNVTSNPYVARNLQYTWVPQYDGGINPGLLGRIRFE